MFLDSGIAFRISVDRVIVPSIILFVTSFHVKSVNQVMINSSISMLPPYFLKVNIHLWSKKESQRTHSSWGYCWIYWIRSVHQPPVRVVLSGSCIHKNSTCEDCIPASHAQSFGLYPMRLIARSILVLWHILSRLQVAINERNVGLFLLGSGPPAFTAMAICLPSLVNVLAMCPTVSTLRLFLYSMFLPISLY